MAAGGNGGYAFPWLASSNSIIRAKAFGGEEPNTSA
jgi:hypothetical protein